MELLVSDSRYENMVYKIARPKSRDVEYRCDKPASVRLLCFLPAMLWQNLALSSTPKDDQWTPIVSSAGLMENGRETQTVLYH